MFPRIKGGLIAFARTYRVTFTILTDKRVEIWDIADMQNTHSFFRGTLIPNEIDHGAT